MFYHILELKMSWDHFETWDLQTDLKAAKTKSQKVLYFTYNFYFLKLTS